MANVDWEMRGLSLNACNCDWGCPCQFNSPPSRGNCRAALAMEIDQGHYGTTDLSGARWAMLFAWPAAVHEGDGEMVIITDSTCTADQRAALHTILNGDETDAGATIFNVFAATYSTVHEPLQAPITFEGSLEERTGTISIPGILDAATEPIRNPVTGATHRAQVVLPHGFEYASAEYCSGDVKSGDPIPHDWQGRHAHYQMLHMTNAGVVR